MSSVFKSRVVSLQEESILLRLNSTRHFGARLHRVVEEKAKETAFRDKVSHRIWLWQQHPLSLGFDLMLGPEHAPWKRYEMSLQRLLTYKYLLSVEGNDVATNLKWALASNSLDRRSATWFMEDALLPYLPVRDDLEKQIEWTERNPKKCEDAHQYVESFLNVKKITNPQWTAKNID